VVLPEAPCGGSSLLAVCQGQPEPKVMNTRTAKSTPARQPGVSYDATPSGGRLSSLSFASADPCVTNSAVVGEVQPSSLSSGAVPRQVGATSSSGARGASDGESSADAQEADEANRRADTVVMASATTESVNLHKSRVLGIIDGWVGDLIGDLKTVLAFASKRFTQDASGDFYVPLVDHTVAGVAMPNPKKAFIGKTLTETSPGGLRIIFAGAHFPITTIADSIETEDASVDALQAAKRSVAGILRKVLRDIGRKEGVDEQTIFFLQGDLNSRTILKGGRPYDILLELLEDRLLQRAIGYNLPGIPRGRWYEMVQHDDARSLPVTYKFTHDAVDRDSAESPSSLTIGAVVDKASEARLFRARAETAGEGHSPAAYKQCLADVGDDYRSEWGIAFKPKNFRPFRFPSSADRLLYWVADPLHSRLEWEFPRGGYQVNYKQGGSDHKPVSLEAILRIRPPPGSSSSATAPVDSEPYVAAARSREGTAMCAEMSEMLDAEVFRDSTGVGQYSLWGKAKAGWNWTPDHEATTCEVCARGFGIFLRRHHCRLCGNCVCGACSRDRQPLPQLNIAELCRICTKCMV